MFIPVAANRKSVFARGYFVENEDYDCGYRGLGNKAGYRYDSEVIVDSFRQEKWLLHDFKSVGDHWRGYG